MAIKTTDYVKFIRGTQAAFDLLTQKDPNTLYFISKEKDSATGALYLGSKLISGGTDAGVSELGDIVINNIGDNQILYFDYEKSAWVNGSVYDLIGSMTGADESTDGTTGLVPVPKAGQHNLFLRGDGEWAMPEFEKVDFDANIFTKNTSGDTSLVNFENAEVGSILIKGEAGKLDLVKEEDFFSTVNTKINDLETIINNFEGGVTRTIVGSLGDINVNAENADKLIFMVPNKDASEGNLYNEYMVIDKKVELIGSNLSGAIDGYVSEDTFTTTVSNLETQISNLDNKFANYVTTESFNTTTSNLQNALNELSGKVDAIEPVDTSNFITVAKYDAEVGALTEEIRTKWGENQTIVKQVDKLTDQVDGLVDQLTWYEL